MEAVCKATLLPAETLGLNSKGRLREGMDADLVVFDINRIADRADFGRPDAPPAGRAGKAVRCTEPVYDYQI